MGVRSTLVGGQTRDSAELSSATLQAEIDVYIDQLVALERQARGKPAAGLCEQVITCGLAISARRNEFLSEFQELLA